MIVLKIPKTLKLDINVIAWWMWPHKLAVFFIMPLFIIIYLSAIGLEHIGYLFYAITYFVVFYIGGFIGGQTRQPSDCKRTNPKFALLLLAVTILAYFIWFGSGFEAVALIVQGEDTSLRGEVETIKGVTTMTQFALPLFVLLGIKIARKESVTRLETFLYIIVGFLTLFRVYAWNERLAGLEIAVALVVPIILMRSERLNQKLVRILPFLAVIILFAIFTISEYFRSWTFYQGTYAGAYVEFIIERFFIYYSSSTSNGVTLMKSTDWPVYTFQTLLSGMVGLGIITDYFDVRSFLTTHASEEFNSFTGILLPIWDLGIFAYLYIFVIGFFGSLSLRELYKGRDSMYALLYPAFLINAAEISRIFYSFGDGRVLAAIFGIALLRLHAKLS